MPPFLLLFAMPLNEDFLFWPRKEEECFCARKGWIKSCHFEGENYPILDPVIITAKIRGRMIIFESSRHYSVLNGRNSSLSTSVKITGVMSRLSPSSFLGIRNDPGMNFAHVKSSPSFFFFFGSKFLTCEENYHFCRAWCYLSCKHKTTPALVCAYAKKKE